MNRRRSRPYDHESAHPARGYRRLLSDRQCQIASPSRYAQRSRNRSYGRYQSLYWTTAKSCQSAARQCAARAGRVSMNLRPSQYRDEGAPPDGRRRRSHPVRCQPRRHVPPPAGKGPDPVQKCRPPRVENGQRTARKIRAGQASGFPERDSTKSIPWSLVGRYGCEPEPRGFRALFGKPRQDAARCSRRGPAPTITA